MKALIAVPSLDYCAADFAMALAALTATKQPYRKFNGSDPSPIKVGLINVQNSNYPDARNTLAQAALDQAVDWLLFLDSDMTFPPDTLSRLAAHRVDIVGASYLTRHKHGNNRLLGHDIQGKPLDLALKGSLAPMLDLPLGCCLIKTSVFKALPTPWFRFPMTETHTLSEDLYFCRAATAAGLRVWCDTTLTREVAHVGTFNYQL